MSPDRFATYLATYRGRHDLASRLYFWNIELTGALWGPIAVLEVCLRNAIHDAMRRGRCDDWWNDRDVRLLERERRGFDAAISTLASRGILDPTPGQVVAGTSFGLWVGLTGAGIPRDPFFSYETSIWQTRLVHAFPNLGAMRRKQMHRRLNDIRILRNRLAHHEPVYRASIETLRDDIVELAGVIDSDVAGAIAAAHRIDEVMTRKRTAITDGVVRL